MRSKLLIGMALCLVISSLGGGLAKAQSDKLTPGDFTFTLQIGDTSRSYVVHVPQSYDGKSPTPIVVMLHGTGGNGKNGLDQGRWIEKSDKEGFIAVGPDALTVNPNRPYSLLLNPTVWDDGSDRGNLLRGNVDDIGFINAVLDDVQARGSIEPNQIFITGFSGGASMTYRVGVELSKRVAAIAPVSGHLWLSNPKLDYPVSLILFAGSVDPLNPLNGGLGKNPWGKPQQKPPFTQSLNTWAKLLNCPTTTSNIYNQNGVTGIAYSPCGSGSEAEFYVVDGMGHNWPGGRAPLPKLIVGPASNAISATDVIWTFFQKHPKQSS